MATSSAQTTLDSHHIYKILVAAGCMRAQANAHADIHRMNAECINNFLIDIKNDLATKEDLRKAMSECVESLKEYSHNEITASVESLKEYSCNRFASKEDVQSIKFTLLKWQVGIGIAIIGIVKFIVQ